MKAFFISVSARLVVEKDCYYCRLNTDNIIIIDKIVVDIKQNKFFLLLLSLSFFFNALSSFMYGMLSFCARFCGCHLVKQQPSLNSLLSFGSNDNVKQN